MKILQLTIKDKNDNAIRNISFKTTGVSYIFADVKEPKNKRKTVNSVGKTLLLKFINYIYGGNEDKEVLNDKIKGYKIIAKVSFESQIYIVTKVIGSKFIVVDNTNYKLESYKEFFKISRSKLTKQIILSKKANEISKRSNPDKQDVITSLELLGLSDIAKYIENIYLIQDNIKKLKENNKQLLSFMPYYNEKNIKDEIFLNDKKVETLENQIKLVEEKIKSIDIVNLQKEVIEERNIKNELFKKNNFLIFKNKSEIQNLNNYIKDSNKTDIDVSELMEFFQKAKQTIPEIIKKEFYEVQIFNQKVYEERKAFLNSEIKKLEALNKNLFNENNKLEVEIAKINNIIAQNQVYSESIELLQKYNNDLKQLTHTQGQLEQVKNIFNKIEEEENKLNHNFENAKKQINKVQDLINEYKEFIYNITHLMYDNDVNVVFDVILNKTSKTTRPISFNFIIKGDAGEGVNEVKKNLFDLLICKYNKELEIMIHDSSCYSGIDPRQVNGLLSMLDEIANYSNKQIIISINKYQLGNNEIDIQKIKDNSVVILSESDKLLKFDF